MLTPTIKQSTTFLKAVYNCLFNNQCCFCLSHSKTQICQDCLTTLPKLLTACPVCAEPNLHGHECGHCLAHPPYFARVFCPYLYQGSVCGLIHGWKHSHNRHVQPLWHNLATLLTEQDIQLVIPVPYHWRKLFIKGHNPVAQLAKYLAQQLQVDYCNAVTRPKAGHSQKGLNRRQRLQLSARSFALKTGMDVVGKHVLLVDDVLTTGATCHGISRLLLAAGAKEVSVACLARTPSRQVSF